MAASGTRTDGNTQWADTLVVSGNSTIGGNATITGTEAVTGAVTLSSTLTVATGTTDGFAIAPPSDFTAVPVTNITYAQALIAGASSTTVSTESMVDATGAVTALLHLDLTNLLCRAGANKGVGVTAITLFYSVVAQVLTAGPTLAVVAQAFPVVGATAVAPVPTSPAGVITSSPVTPPVAIPTAGRFYSVSYTFASTVWLNAPLSRVIAEFGFPMNIGGTVHVAGAMIAYNEARY